MSDLRAFRLTGYAVERYPPDTIIGHRAVAYAVEQPAPVISAFRAVGYAIELALVLRVGDTAIALPGEWANEPDQFDFRWLCDGEPINGATDGTYQIAVEDVGAFISLRVRAHNVFGAAIATSRAVGPVEDAP